MTVLDLMTMLAQCPLSANVEAYVMVESMQTILYAGEAKRLPNSPHSMYTIKGVVRVLGHERTRLIP